MKKQHNTGNTAKTGIARCRFSSLRMQLFTHYLKYNFAVTRIGRLVSMVSSVFGTAVIAMPAGILTAGFMEEINKVRFKNERKLEQEVSELLDEIKQLRKEQAARGLEEKIEKIAAQVEQVQEHRDQDAVLLQDLSEDLKNALARGTINEIKEEAEQV